MSDGNRPTPDAFDFVHDFVTASIQGTLSPSEIDDFETLLRDDETLRRTYARYLETTALMPRLLATAEAADAHSGQDGSARQPSARRDKRIAIAGRRVKERTGRGPALLRNLFRLNGDAPVAAALTWAVILLCTSGIVFTLAFVAMLARNVNPRAARNGAAENRPRDSNESGLPSQANDPALPAGPQAPLGRVIADTGTIARLTRTVDCRWATIRHAPHEGDDLWPGQKLALKSGLAEIIFQSGVRAVLQGPATLEICSRLGASLQQGKLAVRVEDPDARGFEVRTPGMKYTDLGTEFGVWVKSDGTQEMHVFRGQVRAEAAASGAADPGSQTSNPRPLVLSAHQAIRVVGPDRAMERIDGEKGRFVRAMPGPVPFALFSTGAGLDRGAADPHWDIVAVSTDPAFKPRHAFVVWSPDSTYVRDSRDNGQWISLVAEDKFYPEGCRWTYRTTFDLTGFDPKTARIEGQFTVDDYLIELRLNGHPLPIADRGDFKTYHSIEIEKEFVAGVNSLELVILNSGKEMGLCVDFKGTARRLARRN